jgi:RHS repeat-associated protein
MPEPDRSFETRIAKGQAQMNAKQIVIGFAVLAASSVSLLAQTPVLGSIEAPYANLQSTVTLGNHNWGPGSAAYGPVGTPLVLSGSNLGDRGTVQFIAYKNGSPDPNVSPVVASPTLWNSTMIFVPVPAGAYPGMVQINVEGKTSNSLPFIVTPGNYSGSCPAGPTQSQLQIVTASLHDGSVSQSYSATLSSEGGTGNITWSIVSGSLPSGLTLNQPNPNANPPTQASISGTPTTSISQTPLTFEVTDSSSPQQSNQAVLDLTIEQQQLSSTTVYQYTASYDGNGNVSSSSDTVMGSWQYNYDAFNHVRSGTAVSGGSGSQDFTGQNLCWAYDSYGNRTAQGQPPVGAQCSTQNTAVWVYANNNNQVSGVIAPGATQASPSPLTYDPSGAGYVVADLTTGNSYSYDAEGRICAVASPALMPGGQPVLTGYLYDAEGNRIAKGSITSMSCDPTANGFQTTQNYVLGPSGEELSMFDGGNHWQRTNVYAAGKLVGTYDLIADPNSSSPATIPALHFHLEDPLGTRRMQLSAIGQPETDIQSLPFGDELYAFPDVNAPPTADDATPLHFTGKERDQESGNDYFGARYYASAMGRFLSPDWSAKVAPVPYAKLDNPQTLNLYAYVGNNPLAHVDFDGHKDDCAKGSWCDALRNAWNQIHQITPQQQVGLNVQVLRSGNLSQLGQKAANAQLADLKTDMSKIGVNVNITSDSTKSTDELNKLQPGSLDKGAFVYVFGTDLEAMFTSSSGWFGKTPMAVINEGAQGSETGVATHEMLHYLRGDNNTTNPRAGYREFSVEFARKRLDWGLTWGLSYLRDSAEHPPAR